MEQENVSKLNLGCGKDIKEGWVNLDQIKMQGIDVVCNLEGFLPFKDNQFEEVYASHVLEHVHDFVKLMEEVYRVSKPGAKIKIIVPYFASASAFQDPTHIRFFTLKTFNYFLPDNYNNYITKAKFKIAKKKLKWTRKNWGINWPLEFIANHTQWFYERFLCFIIQFQEIEYELEVLK